MKNAKKKKNKKQRVNPKIEILVKYFGYLNKKTTNFDVFDVNYQIKFLFHHNFSLIYTIIFEKSS